MPYGARSQSRLFVEKPVDNVENLEKIGRNGKMAEKFRYMKPEELAAEIKSGGPHGAYIFLGDEDYLKRHYLSEIYKSIMSAEGLELFNYGKISFSAVSGGRDAGFTALASSLSSFPMGQERRLTEIHDLAIDGLPASALDMLCENLKAADETNIAILCLRKNEWTFDYKTENSQEFKKLSAVAKLVRFDIQSKPKLKTWAARHLSREGVRASDAALDILADMCSLEMSVIAEETAKLCFYAHGSGKTEITESDVRSVVSQAVTTEAPPFAMLEAAQKWSISDMYAVAATARDLREEPVALVAKLGKILSDMLRVKAGLEAGLTNAQIAKETKMKEYSVSKYAAAVAKAPISKLEESVRLACETDAALKSTQTDGYVLVDMLIARIYTPRSLLC